MPITAVSTISTERICLNPHEGRSVLGTLGENCYPAQTVSKDESSGKWMLTDTAHAVPGTKFQRIGVVGYEKRVNQSTMALKTITDVWTYDSAGDKLVPIWISGILICYIVDQNADAPPGTDLIISSTAGSLTVAAIETLSDMATATSGKAVMQVVVASAAIRVADNDTVTVIGMGKNYGDIWGGLNTVGA